MKQNKWEKLFDEFMDLIEMGLVKTKEGYFHLKDYTGANLANIESEEFDNVAWLFDRLNNYINDYIIEDIEDCLDEKNLYPENGYANWQDMLNNAKDFLPENKFEFDLLDMICNHFEEINLNNCIYEEDEN